MNRIDPSGYINIDDGLYGYNVMSKLLLYTIIYYVSAHHGMDASKENASVTAQNIRNSNEHKNGSLDMDVLSADNAVIYGFLAAESSGYRRESEAYNFVVIGYILQMLDVNGNKDFYRGEVESRYLEYLTGIAIPNEHGFKALSDENVGKFIELADSIYAAKEYTKEYGGNVYMVVAQDGGQNCICVYTSEDGSIDNAGYSDYVFHL